MCRDLGHFSFTFLIHLFIHRVPNHSDRLRLGCRCPVWPQPHLRVGAGRAPPLHGDAMTANGVQVETPENPTIRPVLIPSRPPCCDDPPNVAVNGDDHRTSRDGLDLRQFLKIERFLPAWSGDRSSKCHRMVPNHTRGVHLDRSASCHSPFLEPQHLI